MAVQGLPHFGSTVPARWGARGWQTHRPSHEGIIHAYRIDTSEPAGWPIRLEWEIIPPPPTLYYRTGSHRLDVRTTGRC
ncbi:MAG: hypothetical protein CME06_03515 [Gemmatimonadetes bacterium]|nr:hypothetical protein [Gemmatimonadota bacterium]